MKYNLKSPIICSILENAALLKIENFEKNPVSLSKQIMNSNEFENLSNFSRINHYFLNKFSILNFIIKIWFFKIAFIVS